MVAVAGAAGGVGTIAVQLAIDAGATVLGIAGPSNDEWLRAHNVIPVNYGDDLAARLRRTPGLTVVEGVGSLDEVFTRILEAIAPVKEVG